MKTLNMQKVMNRASTHGKASMARAEKAREEAKKRRELEEANRAASIPEVVEKSVPTEDKAHKALIDELYSEMSSFLRTYRKCALEDFNTARNTWKHIVDEINNLNGEVSDLDTVLCQYATKVGTYLDLAEKLHALNNRQNDVRKNDPRIKLQPWDKAVVDAHHLADKAFSNGEKEIGKQALLLARDINVTH